MSTFWDWSFSNQSCSALLAGRYEPVGDPGDFFIYGLTSRHFIWSTTKLFDQPLVITEKNDRISCLRIDRYFIPLVKSFLYDDYL